MSEQPKCECPMRAALQRLRAVVSSTIGGFGNVSYDWQREVQEADQALAASCPLEAENIRLRQELQGRYESILGPELFARREAQDTEHGGPTHDDMHEFYEFNAFIRNFNDRSERAGYGYGSTVREQIRAGNPSLHENYLIDVAALAIAAIQSSRRKRKA